MTFQAMEYFFGLVKRHPYYCALFNGFLLALSQVMVVPGGYFLPWRYLSWLAWVGLIPLLVLMDQEAEKKNYKEMVRISSVCFFVYYTVGFYWLMICMAYYGNIPWIATFFLLSLVTLTCTFQMACAPLLGYYFKDHFSIPLILTIPLVWVAGEWGRQYSFSGLSWLYLSDSQAFGNLYIVQMADLLGQKGVSWVLVSTNVFLASVFLRKAKVWEGVFVFLILLSVHTYGYYHLHGQIPIHSKGKTFRIAALQGNISLDQKWDRHFRGSILEIFNDLIEKAEKEQADLILWPEAGYPFVINRDGKTFPTKFKTNLPQVIGVPTSRGRTLLNTAFLIDQNENILGAYDKIHLVPFGEYIPLKEVLFFVRKIVNAIGTFTKGEKAVPIPWEFDNETLQLGVLMCYEDVFPEIAVESRRNGAQVLLNLTNDSWYGRSSAAYQHLALSIYRGVENRVPVVRATNTGISAAINPQGRVIKQLPWYEKGYFIYDVPIVNEPISFYSKHGPWFPKLAAVYTFSLLIGCLITSLQKRYQVWRGP